MNDQLPSLGPAVALGGQSELSEQDRLKNCNAEIIIALNHWGCDLRALPQARVEGMIVLVEAVPQLIIRQHWVNSENGNKPG